METEILFKMNQNILWSIPYVNFSTESVSRLTWDDIGLGEKNSAKLGIHSIRGFSLFLCPLSLRVQFGGEPCNNSLQECHVCSIISWLRWLLLPYRIRCSIGQSVSQFMFTREYMGNDFSHPPCGRCWLLHIFTWTSISPRLDYIFRPPPLSSSLEFY